MTIGMKYKNHFTKRPSYGYQYSSIQGSSMLPLVADLSDSGRKAVLPKGVYSAK